MKNLAAKRRNLNAGQAPYEVWEQPGWGTYLVVKKNQAPDKEATNPYAIWNTAFVGRHETDMVGHDTYVADVKQGSRLIWVDPEYVAAITEAGQPAIHPAGVDADSDGWKRYVSS